VRAEGRIQVRRASVGQAHGAQRPLEVDGRDLGIGRARHVDQRLVGFQAQRAQHGRQQDRLVAAHAVAGGEHLGGGMGLQEGAHIQRRLQIADVAGDEPGQGQNPALLARQAIGQLTNLFGQRLVRLEFLPTLRPALLRQLRPAGQGAHHHPAGHLGQARHTSLAEDHGQLAARPGVDDPVALPPLGERQRTVPDRVAQRARRRAADHQPLVQDGALVLEEEEVGIVPGDLGGRFDPHRGLERVLHLQVRVADHQPAVRLVERMGGRAQRLFARAVAVEGDGLAGGPGDPSADEFHPGLRLVERQLVGRVRLEAALVQNLDPAPDLLGEAAVGVEGDRDLLVQDDGRRAAGQLHVGGRRRDVRAPGGRRPGGRGHRRRQRQPADSDRPASCVHPPSRSRPMPPFIHRDPEPRQAFPPPRRPAASPAAKALHSADF